MKAKLGASFRKPLVNDRIQLTIEKMAVGGAGLARWSPENSKASSGAPLKTLVVFVRDVCPGDVIDARIYKVHKNHLEAVLERVINPSPERRNPPCQHAKECGGCSWQRISNFEQLRQKHLFIKEAFAKFAPTLKVPEFTVRPSPSEFGYRNRVQPKFQQGKLGFYKTQSRELVDIQNCMLMEPAMQAQWPALREYCMSHFRDNQLHRLEFALNIKGEVVHRELKEDSDLGQFSQINRLQNLEMLEHAIDWLGASTPNPPPMVLDLYAGSGNFTIPLAKHFQDSGTRVVGVEFSPELANRAREGFKSESVRAEMITADVEQYLLNTSIPPESMILMDPPRIGANEKIMKKLAQMKLRTLIYVSCHPVSLARDIQWLHQETAATGKQVFVRKLQGFEMFPQTDHVETMIELGFH